MQLLVLFTIRGLVVLGSPPPAVVDGAMEGTT
jgi:hypothetical protein